MTIDNMIPHDLDDIYGPGAEDAAGYEGMTIEECLMMAQENLRWIINYSGETLERKQAHSAIAQAAALTAQAMDYHRYVEAWIAMGDLVDARAYENTPEM